MLKNIAGERFGKLLVLKQAGKSPDRHLLWKCRCDCGALCVKNGSKLRSGHTVSCGCQQKVSNFKHGLTGTREITRVYERRRRDKEKSLDVVWTSEMELLLRKLFPICIVCGNEEDLCVDHVKPLSKGYGLVPGNAIILCRKCNSKKRDKFPEDLSYDMKFPITILAEFFKERWEMKQNNEAIPIESYY